MNRAERRKMQKQGLNEKGQKVYKLTQRQLDDIIVKAVRMKQKEITDKVTSEVTTTLLLFTLDVLHWRFKFGAKRLKRFKYELDRLSEIFVDDEDTNTQDLYDELNKAVDLEFMNRRVSEDEVRAITKDYKDFEQLVPFPTKGAEK